MKFGLQDKQIAQISFVLKSGGVTQATIFGSRAKGDYRDNSDIDIAVWGDEINVGRLLTELDDLPLPFKFDVIDYNETNTAIREHIDRVGIIFLDDDGTSQVAENHNEYKNSL